MVDAFAPAGSHGFSYSGGKIGSVWSNWFGAAFQSLAWDSTVDADGNAGSGSLKLLANFPGTGSNQFTVINGFSGISPSIPSSIWNPTSRRSAAWSTAAPSAVNGVTSTV